MHAKYLAILALSSIALAQDVPTLDEWIDENGGSSDIEVTDDILGSSDSTSSSSPSTYTSSPSADDEETSGSGSSGLAGLEDIPNSVMTQLATAIPTSVLQELATPASIASLSSQVMEGNYPAWVTDLPDDAREYIESAWSEAAGTTSAPSSGGNGDEESSSGDGEGAAGMLSPSVFASVFGAVGVLAVALAL
ncbi:hypothetical protein BDW62DRAFT_193471 [Aspergillus aurantiobrunneus]